MFCLLSRQYNTCNNTKRKNNASKLILLLKDENIRWNEQLVQLHNEENNFLGDIIISALFIS